LEQGKLKLGTRSSRLSLAQTEIVVQALKKVHPDLEVEVFPVKTLGDRLPPEQRASVGEKAAFTQDIDDLLLGGVLDLAVHSLKDLPTASRQGIVIAATPPREDARDALVASGNFTLKMIPQGGKIGTSSLRRRAQLLRLRGDLQIVETRGNVETRLKKISDAGLDGVVLAAAGLKRIGESSRISQLFSPYEMVPAVGQGILAVEAREEDKELVMSLSSISDRDTRLSARCERAFSRKLGGDCDVPLGAHAEVSGDTIMLTGMIASADGTGFVKKSHFGSASDPEGLGEDLALSLLAAGGSKILEALGK